MKHIQHIIGITAFGGIKDVGKTKFCLRLANYFAQQGKSVLFLSYADLYEQYRMFLETYDTGIHACLECENMENFDYNINSFELFKYLSDNHFSTVFIDNFESFCISLSDIQYIAHTLHIAFFVNIKIPTLLPHNEYDFLHYCDGTHTPTLKIFAYTNEQYIHYCTTIYALHRPFQFGITQDTNNNSLTSVLELYSLKNNNCNHEKRILNSQHYGIYEIEKIL